MLGIKTKDIFFDLYPNSTITLELNNPVFDDDFLKGNYSFPFKIPLTPKNRQLLNFANEVGSFINFNDPLPVDIYIDGLTLFRNGALYIKTVFETYAECYILIGISIFAKYANETKLADAVDYFKELSPIQPGEAGYDPDKDCAVIAANSLNETVDTLPYIFFPVVNDAHNKNYTPDATAAIAHYMYNMYYDNAFIAYQNSTITQRKVEFSMVPFFYNTYVLRTIFRNYNLVENIFDKDAELKTLVLLNNFALDLWRTEGGNKLVKTSGRNIEAKNHVPDLTIGEYLMQLKKMFCLYLYQQPFENKIYFDTIQSVLESTDITDLTNISFPYAEITQEERQGIKFTPEAGGDSVISSIPSTKPEKIAGAVLDAQLDEDLGFQINDVVLFYNKNRYYKWDGTTWKGWGAAYGDFYIKPNTYEVTTKFSATDQGQVIITNLLQAGTTNNIFCPKINIPGSYFDADGNPVTSANCIKLAFYRGIAFDASYPYPFGSSNNFFGLYVSPTQFGSYSLAYYGPYGLNDTWWKGFIKFRDNSKIVKAKLKLDMRTLLTLDLHKKIRIGSYNFFIKKLSLQLPLTKPAEAELITATIIGKTTGGPPTPPPEPINTLTFIMGAANSSDGRITLGISFQNSTAPLDDYQAGNSPYDDLAGFDITSNNDRWILKNSTGRDDIKHFRIRGTIEVMFQDFGENYKWFLQTNTPRIFTLVSERTVNPGVHYTFTFDILINLEPNERLFAFGYSTGDYNNNKTYYQTTWTIEQYP